MVHALEINPTTFPAARFGDFATLLNIVIPLLLTVAAFVFLVIMIWAGITWLTAGGNKEQLAQAKKIITNGVLGLVIIAVSYLVVKLIQFVFNIQGPL